MTTVTSLVIFLLMATIPLWVKMDISSINKNNNNKTVIFNNKINTIEKDNSASKGGRKLTRDTGILGANSDILIGTVWVFKEVLIQALGDP